MTLDTKVSALPRIGSNLTKSLHTLGIDTVRDVLFHFPYRYLDFRTTKKITDIRAGETVTITATIKTIIARRSFRSRVSLCEAVVSDDSGSLKVVWFNQPYLAQSLKSGQTILLSGRVEYYKTLQLINPIYELYTEDAIHTSRLVPVYHSTETVYNKTLRSLVKTCLPLASQLTDELPVTVERENGLIPLAEAIVQAHFPDSRETLTRATFRIAFGDVFLYQLAAGWKQQQSREVQHFTIPPDIELIKSFVAKLPFTLTASQKRAAWDILQDMETGRAMRRLLQGDVGSGKTVVAMIAGLSVAHAGYQTALLAPTEILARQHFETFLKLFPESEGSIALLTRTFSQINGDAMDREHVLTAMSDGSTRIIIGTHALLQQQVKFSKLALLIIDEQHRFGVAQRSSLTQTTEQNALQPHLLSMSATPIPRTLALSLYGNLEVSTLSQVPSGRKAIITKIVSEAHRAKAYQLITEQLKQGRQGYVITPLVETSEKSERKAVKDEFARLQKTVFKDFRVGLVYGSMKGTEKEAVMQAFAAHELDILVATSVIEIGIDVPNSTVMIIEGAESFGLAQLHQLRGRVGRGQEQSYCFLFTTNDNGEELERLKLFSSTTDGFKLATLDLEQRGFGDLFGTMQTGFAFRFPKFITLPVLEKTRDAAAKLIQNDPQLGTYPQLLIKIEEISENFHVE